MRVKMKILKHNVIKEERERERGSFERLSAFKADIASSNVFIAIGVSLNLCNVSFGLNNFCGLEALRFL
jgi:hypothetical protein